MGVAIGDGYGQTETGPVTGMRPDEDDPARDGSMGRPLPGIEVRIAEPDGAIEGRPTEGELQVRPETVPDLLQPLPRRGAIRRRVVADRRSRPRGRGRLPVVRGPGRRHHHHRRLPGGPVRGRVGARHPSRGGGSRRDPGAGRGAGLGGPRDRRPRRRRPSERLAAELQEHVKRVTAPYKYPRIVEFADSLPKTSSGKIRRAELRDLMRRPVAGLCRIFIGHPSSACCRSAP